jgi:hypothetical protein
MGNRFQVRQVRWMLSLFASLPSIHPNCSQAGSAGCHLLALLACTVLQVFQVLISHACIVPMCAYACDMYKYINEGYSRTLVMETGAIFIALVPSFSQPEV